MAGLPRNIRIEDDIYSALIQCVAARRARGEDIDITKLINESLRLQMPIHVWDRLSDRVNKLEKEILNSQILKESKTQIATAALEKEININSGNTIGDRVRALEKRMSEIEARLDA